MEQDVINTPNKGANVTKRKTNSNLGLGLFVLIGVILFIAGIYYVGQRHQVFRKTFKLSTIFRYVNGLQPGNNVRLSGIDVGVVDDIIQTTDSTVKVDMQIDERSRKFIKKDAKASIGSDGLIGNKIILITPDLKGDVGIRNNDFIESVAPIDMDHQLLVLKATGDSAYVLTCTLTAIAKNIRAGKGAIGMLFSDTVFARNLGITMENIKQGTQGFKQNMDAASHSILLRGLIKKNIKKGN
jgi:phospholipid/cholesterol/gamma-HCH transport system substrate-binding protein